MSDPPMADGQMIFACDMTAIAPQDRRHHMEVALKLFRAVTEIADLPDGFAFHLPQGDDVLFTAVEFISREKLCCPFFRFDVQIDAGGGSQWLHLTGPKGVKPVIQAEIGRALSPAVAKNAGFLRSQ